MQVDYSNFIVERTAKYAIFDELAYYNSLYASSGYKPNPCMYEIISPFRMDSQVDSLLRGTSCRKRKKKLSNSAQRVIPEKWSKICRHVEQCYDFLRIGSGPQVPNESEDDLKNSVAKASASMARNIVLSELGFYIAEHGDSSICEFYLNNSSSSLQNVPSECTFWNNRNHESVVLSLNKEQFIIPPQSSFILGDVRLSRHLVSRGLVFDLIVLDPPWNNKSVKRKSEYGTFDDSALFELRLQELLQNDGLIVVWITNNIHIRSNVTDFLSHHGLRRLAIWHWLKVTRSGEKVCDFRPMHKVPFESFLIACKKPSAHLKKNFVDNFVLISTPCAIHSRKPPVLPILAALNVFPARSCLELYGRYLLPLTTTIGFEALKLQDTRLFDVCIESA